MGMGAKGKLQKFNKWKKRKPHWEIVRKNKIQKVMAIEIPSAKKARY